MGTSGNWFKLFIHHRKTNPNDQEKVLCGKRNKKWKLWRSSSSSESSKDSKSSVNRVQVAASESSELPAVDDVYSAAMATLVRAPPKDFLVIRQEWAAIRIQTAFRALLARRALRALKGIVRLQAVVRGWLVRKQAAMTLKCMQALVRAQAQVKAHRVKMSLEESSVQKTVDNQSDLVKQEEGKWCDSRGSIEEVKTKQQMRQEAAMKRERAMAYFISQQQLRASPNIKNNSEWSWLQGWMASKKTSENRKIESSSRKNSKTKATSSNSCCSSSSQMSSRVMNTESSFSSSTAFEATEDSASSGSVSLSKPRYMNVTASNKAKQREGISKSRVREEARNYVKSGLRFSGEVTRNSVDSAPCSNVVRSEESSLNRHDWIRCR